MYRFFDPVIRPLLDAAAPAVVVEVGSDKGLGTELLADWCVRHDAVLHCVDPLPKYDVEEWLTRWPNTLRFHRDLSLNALVDIRSVDFVCIDGDHNWYTVFHELEILGRSAAADENSFPLTLLHDVGWPYGRRDLYYDPGTIPGAFRHPHRKNGILPDKRSLAASGFNDHLENAIHEGTPRNGVLTAAEDFVAQYDGELTLQVVTGLHGLAIIMDARASDRVAKAVEEVLDLSGLGRVLESVEEDRISRLGLLWKSQHDLQRERDRVQRASDEADKLRARTEKLRRTLDEHREATEIFRREVLTAKSLQESAETQAKRAEEWYRQAVVQHDQEVAALSNQIDDVARQFAEEQTLRRRSEHDLNRLRGRRSVRFATSLAKLARPAFRLRRGQLGRSKPPNKVPDIGDAKEDGGGSPPAIPVPVGRSPLADLLRNGETGRFFELVRELVDQGVSHDFVDAWNASEAATGETVLLPDVRPLVSIIMPTYNRAGVIGDAIASVLEQTYQNWELLVCDDASEDDTEAVVRASADPRISYQKLLKGGAARARNAGLDGAQGDFIAYLDSDNLWHPSFLETLVSALILNSGHYCAYSKYIDVIVSSGQPELKKADATPFDYDALAERNFIDLNSLVHRRVLYDHLGGFDERLVRQQDWDLILRYSFLRDPLHIDRFLMMYRRSDDWNQITKVHKDDRSSPVLVRSSVAGFYRDGLPTRYRDELPSLSVLSWDICRNHFSKAYNVAEAIADRVKVQLLGFRFFENPVFRPYADARPEFETCYLPGGEFPDWNSEMARAVANASGDVVYAVKPRLPSLGVALLANYHFGKPVVLEINDLESVVTNPRPGDDLPSLRLADVDPDDPELLNPYGQLWTRIMEGLAPEVPHRVTHNSALDQHFGGGAFFLRNPKDEKFFDPANFNREEVRQRLGFGPRDRVILFGGMVRRHKGVFQLMELLEKADSSYRLLVVGARDTPDQSALRDLAGDRVQIIEPVDRNEMAAINLASDAVVLWLDPSIPASHYQMPFKLTDALAMKVPVLANDIGDLGELGRQGYLRLVPFGRTEELASALQELRTDPDSLDAMVEAGRRLYLRQFSYNAVRSNMEMILTEAASSTGTLPIAEEFANFFSKFQSRLKR